MWSERRVETLSETGGVEELAGKKFSASPESGETYEGSSYFALGKKDNRTGLSFWVDVI